MPHITIPGAITKLSTPKIQHLLDERNANPIQVFFQSWIQVLFFRIRVNKFVARTENHTVTTAKADLPIMAIASLENRLTNGPEMKEYFYYWDHERTLANLLLNNWMLNIERVDGKYACWFTRNSESKSGQPKDKLLEAIASAIKADIL